VGFYSDWEDELVPAGDDQAQTEFAVKFDDSLIVRIYATLHIFGASRLEVQA
jgi:hypothetical protein